MMIFIMGIPVYSEASYLHWNKTLCQSPKTYRNYGTYPVLVTLFGQGTSCTLSLLFIWGITLLTVNSLHNAFSKLFWKLILSTVFYSYTFLPILLKWSLYRKSMLNKSEPIWYWMPGATDPTSFMLGQHCLLIPLLLGLHGTSDSQPCRQAEGLHWSFRGGQAMANHYFDGLAEGCSNWSEASDIYRAQMG